MKSINQAVTALAIVATLNACTPKMTFVTSSVVPSATGSIKVKKDRNNNYVLNVSVINLADPQKLTPAKDTYLVWMESDGNSVKKLGQIMPHSKVLKGELNATSVAKPTDIFITAEDNVDRNFPDGQVILTTKK